MNNQIITKDDIKELATKSELKATRTELKQVEKNLRKEILRVEARVEALEERMDEFEKNMTKMIIKLQNTLDGFVGVVDELRTENQVGAYQLRDLEGRVTKLESSSRTT